MKEETLRTDMDEKWGLQEREPGAGSTAASLSEQGLAKDVDSAS